MSARCRRSGRASRRSGAGREVHDLDECRETCRARWRGSKLGAMKLILCLCLGLTVGQLAAAQEIPPDVMKRVRADIEARYPDNYSMQKLLIEDQVRSYRALHP